ncbi:MAG: DUF2934 domain-containing protein [Terriglobales bacterium]
MARKTNGSTTSTRSKKAQIPVPPATVEVAAEVSTDGRKNGKTANLAAANRVTANIEEEIRRRAYELYLQRRATASGGQNGDENQDWLIAEREILSRQGSQGQHTA